MAWNKFHNVLCTKWVRGSRQEVCIPTCTHFLLVEWVLSKSKTINKSDISDITLPTYKKNYRFKWIYWHTVLNNSHISDTYIIINKYVLPKINIQMIHRNALISMTQDQ